MFTLRRIRRNSRPSNPEKLVCAWSVPLEGKNESGEREGGEREREREREREERRERKRERERKPEREREREREREKERGETQKERERGREEGREEGEEWAQDSENIHLKLSTFQPKPEELLNLNPAAKKNPVTRPLFLYTNA